MTPTYSRAYQSLRAAEDAICRMREPIEAAAEHLRRAMCEMTSDAQPQPPADREEVRLAGAVAPWVLKAAQDRGDRLAADVARLTHQLDHWRDYAKGKDDLLNTACKALDANRQHADFAATESEEWRDRALAAEQELAAARAEVQTARSLLDEAATLLDDIQSTSPEDGDTLSFEQAAERARAWFDAHPDVLATGTGSAT